MEKQEFKMQISPETAEGKYSNGSIITHTRHEFIMDFASLLPGNPNPVIVSRVIMSPEILKQTFHAIKSNMDAYEKKFGEINEDKTEQSFMLPLQGQSKTKS